MTKKLADRCIQFQDQMMDFVEYFLWAALGAALVGLAAEVATKLVPLFRKDGSLSALRTESPPHAVTLLDAVRNLIDSLAKAPLWLGLFGAGILLLWALGTLKPAFC